MRILPAAISSLSTDLREVRHCSGRLADGLQQGETVGANGWILIIDEHRFEEGIDRTAQLGESPWRRRRPQLPRVSPTIPAIVSILSAASAPADKLLSDDGRRRSKGRRFAFQQSFAASASI